MGRYDALTQIDTKAKKAPSLIEKPANPQTVLSERPQAPFPANLQDGKPAKLNAGKSANQQTRIPASEQVEKYTTRLEPSLIKEIKVFAAQHDMADYEVVQQAVKEYFAKRK